MKKFILQTSLKSYHISLYNDFKTIKTQKPPRTVRGVYRLAGKGSY